MAWLAGEATTAFGTNKGRALRDLANAEPNYLVWTLDNDFASDAQETVRAALRSALPPAKRALSLHGSATMPGTLAVL